MFDGKYFDWNQKRVKGIVDYYGYKFFYGKKLADLGCGHADLSGVVYRLGSDITAVDARQEHLKIVTKKFPGIKTVKGNLDGPWPFHGQKFDMILDLGLLCHLASYENHLKAVCASTTYLVLECAVCDSDDPSKCVQVPEAKEVYDLAYNGMGCRPSAAAIERVLTECHMSFKRVDNARFNSGEYVYDWQAKNDGSTSIYKRRIWFATKNQPGVTLPESAGQQSAVVVAPPSPPSSYLNFQRNGIPTILSAQARPPMSALLAHPVHAGHPGVMPSNVGQSSNYVELKPDSLNYQVMQNSKEFSIVSPENYAAPHVFETGGVILTNTPSARMWMRKIAPMFPHLKVSAKDSSMMEFSRTADQPGLAMCSINNLIACDRIWIDEWDGPDLMNAQVEILNECRVIITPSITNLQSLQRVLPNAKILRFVRPWPMLITEPIKYDYFLYFEKDAKITQTILDSWDEKFGKIIIVGSHLKLPPSAEYVSDAVDYKSICTLFMGAKAVIDISPNNYYASGILRLAEGYGLPSLSNNQFVMNQANKIFMSGDSVPNSDEIRKSIGRFLAEFPKTPAKYSADYNYSVNQEVQKLLAGV
jgi:SAM-dependent methyltransferase